MMNRAGFAIVHHENGDVRKGRALNRPKWTALEDQVLYDFVHRRLSTGLKADADEIFDEIVAVHPTWQRSVLAIKTRIPEHATKIRAEMLRLAKAETEKVRRKSDKKLQEKERLLFLLENNYQELLHEAMIAYDVLRKEYQEMVVQFTRDGEELAREKEKIAAELRATAEHKAQVEEENQELKVENKKLSKRIDAVKNLMNFCAVVMRDPDALDVIANEIDFLSDFTAKLIIASNPQTAHFAALTDDPDRPDPTDAIPDGDEVGQGKANGNEKADDQK